MLLKLYLALIYSALGAVGLLFLQTGHWPVTLLLWGGNALPAAEKKPGSRQSADSARSRWAASSHGADPVEEIGRFKGKIHFVQIRDLVGRWPKSQEVFPGTGELDFRVIIQALHDSGYRGFMHPEHLGQPRFPGEDLEQVSTWLVKRWGNDVQTE